MLSDNKVGVVLLTNSEMYHILVNYTSITSINS